MAERRRSGPVSNSFSDATSASGVGPSGGDLSYVPSDVPVLMEGVLKKRGANLPVMRDRYCVATWEADPHTHARVVRLRTYKSQKSYAKSRDKPVSSHVLKCFGEWDGKGNFHKYEHAFLMETDESKVFFCTAPSEAEKRRWIDVMRAIDSAENSLVESSRSVGAHDELKQAAKRQSSVRPSLLRGQSSNLRNERSESAAFQSDSEDDDHDRDEDGLHDEEFYANEEQHSVTDSEEHSRDDGLFRSSSGAGSELNGLDGRGERASKSEPADWGIYGDNYDQPTVSRYDAVDRPVVLLDEELLHEKADKAPLASDLFLFDDAGPSRFGAVTIKKKEGENDDDLADFVDEELAARLEREKSEKILRKRVQKLESNRDLYAEMAAARLARCTSSEKVAT
uniref:PH domain-containing protein n=1 Tax=Globisporangium ultimum (strain ATCC 200006 / CBS 805.95 / DAOM BR144) TaxID=431595 RepID=K3WAS3_GLOUD